MQTNVPIDLQVPVDLEVPVDMTIEVPVSTEVPIEADIPIKLEFPVTISLEEMGIGELLTQVQDGLRLLVTMLEEQAGNN
jgi:hypothetical protein